ncbi:hypothetical protein L7D48_19875 [Streptomyces sp. S1A]|uniref:hypothetical protein n=1 Tax=Streptomyces sp. ICN903 TaxID=2964654 RepID=UPI001EDC84B0|nr:hypothetical protein [Streptomyces sp. ICN903]MCG3042805.1 hypothetical protein [Streptomyces sp. ICN903]
MGGSGQRSEGAWRCDRCGHEPGMRQAEEILARARRRAEEIVRAAHEEAERDLAALAEHRDRIEAKLLRTQEMVRVLTEAAERAGPPPRPRPWERLRRWRRQPHRR